MGKDPVVELKLSCCMSHMSTTHLKHKLIAALYQEVPGDSGGIQAVHTLAL